MARFTSILKENGVIKEDLPDHIQANVQAYNNLVEDIELEEADEPDEELAELKNKLSVIDAEICEQLQAYFDNEEMEESPEPKQKPASGWRPLI